MSVIVTLRIGGQPLEVEFDDHALATIAAATTPQPETAEPSPYMTIPEAALYIGYGYVGCRDCGGDDCRRCHGIGQVVNRQRVDDLLSARRLERVKEGSRTLIRRSDLDRYLDGGERRNR
jgi:hypothetical protein